MEDLRREKMRTCCLAAVCVLGMYVLFRFVFPVILPFVLAFLLALLMSPFVRLLNRRLHIKRSIATLIIMTVLLVIIMTLGNWLVIKLIGQLRNFIANFGYYEELVFDKLNIIGRNMEDLLHLEEHTVSNTIRDNMEIFYEEIWKGSIAPKFMDNSVSVVKWLVSAVAVTIVVVITTFLVSKDWEKLKEGAGSSIFSQEVKLIADKLSCVGSAYVKTQFILMVITMTICVGGLTIQGNPYSLLLGVIIGFMDALPLIGTGLFFVPWIITMLLMGDYLYAAGLLVIYLLCYFVREFLEPKLMGHHVGVSSLEMIVSMFIGLELFGISGLFLGPVGYILLKEILRKPQIT